MSQLFFIPQAVRINSVGTPYAGAKATFYLTGTSTKSNVFTDSARAVAHTNPVIAASDGQFAPIYLNPAITYRCVVTESDDTLLDDVDPIGTPITASDVAIVDGGGYYAGIEVETALADIGANYAKKSATNTWTAEQTFSATLNMADQILQRPQIKDFSITHSVLTQTSGTVDCDLSTANSFYFVLTENATITLSNPPSSGNYGQVTIRIKQDGSGGAYTVAWPAAMTWSGGAPTMSPGNDAIDVFTVFTDDAGTLWHGNYAQIYA